MNVTGTLRGDDELGTVFAVELIFQISSTDNLAVHFFICTGIMSQHTLTADELASLKFLLSKAQKTGLTKEILDLVYSDENPSDDVSSTSWDVLPGGAMTDGSKRQLSPDPETRVKTGKIQNLC